MGEWCFREKAESFAERLWRARWRIPDCERALLANGQKNRCEVAHALSLSVRLGADVCAFSRRATLVSTPSLSFYPPRATLFYSPSLFLTRIYTYIFLFSFPFASVPFSRTLVRHTGWRSERVAYKEARSRGRRNSRRRSLGKRLRNL